jgi:hypothetical protein
VKIKIQSNQKNQENKGPRDFLLTNLQKILKINSLVSKQTLQLKDKHLAPPGLQVLKVMILKKLHLNKAIKKKKMNHLQNVHLEFYLLQDRKNK